MHNFSREFSLRQLQTDTPAGIARTANATSPRIQDSTLYPHCTLLFSLRTHSFRGSGRVLSKMQDPSYGVAPQLVSPQVPPSEARANTSQQNHVHLISGHRYPLSPILNIDAAYRHLAEAPTIVKQVAPMAWQYVQAPQDGTVWLEWISPRGGEYRFATDGYVWGDQETSRREDFGGYTIEILTHTIGYRLQYDQMATHARTRYHLVAKHPSANAPPPDPNLWLVHYHQAEQSRFMPSNTIPIHPQMRQQMGERKWLESQGRIERREFMLHDREHWPQVTLPGHMPQQQGGHPGMNPMMAQQQMPHARHPSYPWPQGAGQGPPAKRPRHSGPSGAPGSSEGVIDTSIEDEENVSLGDYFDHLSQRDISTTRYMQHHRWMEEIFSSPYASSQIIPTDLGLGLMGALKGLTDGILEPPSVDEMNANAPKPPKAKEAGRFTNLKKEQVEEFNARVQKHLDEGQAEIERMKREHAEKMAELKKGSVLMQAERRLRTATWKERESRDPAFRLDGIPDTDGPRETVEDIVKDVESRLNVKITGYDDTTLIEKGGFQEKQDNIRDDFFSNGQPDAQMQGMEQVSMGGANGDITAVANGSQHGSSATTEPQAPAKAFGDTTQPNYLADQQAQMPAAPGLPDDEQSGQPHQSDLDQDDMFGDGGDLDMGDTSMMEGMGMDIDVDNGGIDTSNIDFLEDPSADIADPTAPQADDPTSALTQGTDLAAPPATTTALPSEMGGEQQQAAEAEQASSELPMQPDTIPNPATATSQPAPDPEPEASAVDDALFNDSGDFPDTTFDDLGNIDGHNDADDDVGLGDVDFGMDESAFEGAIHGMEGTGDDDEGAEES